MRSLIHSFTAGICLCLAVMLPATSAEPEYSATDYPPDAVLRKDGKLYFTLLNISKQSIFKLYLRPHGTEDWGRNYLADDWIDDEENMKLFVDGEETCRDIKVEAEEESFEFTDGFNVGTTISVLLMGDDEGNIHAHMLPKNFAACAE